MVQAFLSTDVCCRVSDKYLLAMALTYFKRAGLPTSEYTPLNLFAALYLASDMEEDEEEPKLLLLAGALGHRWRREQLLRRLLRRRDRLWARMSYRAAVSRHCCEEVMAAEPLHWAWGRERAPPHSGAARAPSCPRCARHPPGEEEEEEGEEGAAGAAAAPAPRDPRALIWGKTRRNRGCPAPDLGDNVLELGPPHTR
ncbi:speedy protein C isoform X2 [Aphelocoma coerulescens]